MRVRYKWTPREFARLEQLRLEPLDVELPFPTDPAVAWALHCRMMHRLITVDGAPAVLQLFRLAIRGDN